MEALILYFGKVILCSGVMFLYYQLSLKDRTFHHYNRFYLLSAMLISILLPLVEVEDFTIEVSSDLYLLINRFQNLNTDQTINNDYIYFRIIFSALGLVSFYFLGKLIYGILKIAQFKKQFQKETFEGVNFYQTNLSEAPFSYFKNLFWKNTIVINSDIGRQILKHEMVHIEQKHSYDKIFIEIITSIFWFNPFFHIIKKEINLIHEYLADKKAVRQSDTKAFAQMLLASHFSGTQLPATSPFLSSNLKKRLKMLQKPKTKFGYARRIFALPVLFTVAFAYMVNAKNKEITETNIQISKAVSEIKKDTISTKNSIDQIVEKQESKILKANENLKVQAEKLKTLSEKSKEKAEELKKIAREKGEKSYEFELKAKELKQLSGEMDKIIDKDLVYQLDFENLDKIKSTALSPSPRFKVEKLELKNVFPDGGRIRINDKNENILDLSDIKDLNLKLDLDNKKLEELLVKVKSPEFKDAVKKFKDANPYANAYSYDELKNMLTYSFNEASKEKLSKKELRKLEKLSKEKAEISRKQAEISKKQAEIVKDKTQSNPWMISVAAHTDPKIDYSVNSKYIQFEKKDSNKTVKTQTSRVITDGNDLPGNNKIYIDSNDAFEENMKIIIDGKESTKHDLSALNPNKIRDMNITKNKINGKTVGEISVNTKKNK